MTNKEKVFKILGRIVDHTTLDGIAGLRVEAWDKDLIFNDLVGSDETDAEGRFHIEFAESYFSELFFDREPDLFFKVFSDGEMIKSTEDSVLWNTRAETTPLEIVVSWTSGGGSDGNGSAYVVTGTVTSPTRGGVGSLRVRIVDKNVGQDVPLAEAITDERGRYTVSFASSSLRERGKKQPDLQARVYAGQEFLAASDVHYNATREETLNVNLPANSTALPSEHETLTDALQAHYAGELRNLEESDQRQDITYLANKTGWDARAVALAALADQFSRQGAETGGAPPLKPAFYYALFRAGMPANPDILFRADSQTVERMWKQAIEQGVIPRAMEREMESAVKTFQFLSAQRLLTGEALVGASSLKEMLGVSSLDAAEQKQFAELYAAHRTDMSTFWKAVGDRFGANKMKRLQLDGRLGLLTINNAPLIEAVHKAAGANGLDDPVELARRGYHRAAQWSQLLSDNVPVPEEIPGDTPAARRTNYAEYLGAQLRLSYPTASVAEMVKSGDLPVNAPEQVDTFLTEHQGKFEIGMQPVEQYIARNNLDVPKETVAQVKRLQRVYQFTPSDQAMIGLMKRGIDAAYHVASYEKETFVENFAEDLGGAEMAALTYDKARQVHGAVLNIAISYLTSKNGIGLGATPMKALKEESSNGMKKMQVGLTNGSGQIIKPAPQGPADPNANDIIAYPTLEGLFGELDFCACDHCRSVLSPAAYLVDLLLFIDRPPAESNKDNPQTVLFQRRPDIQHLPLTCENTNTALPYIDVVNETLEYFIANDIKPLSLNGYVGHDTDGAASEDLLASPQSFNDGVRDTAYTILRGESFPPPLPFHQPLDNLRRYFDGLEVPLTMAMERMRKSDTLDVDRNTNPPPPLSDYGWRDILMEELGLSRAEHEILTDSEAVPLWKMYGFANVATDAVVIDALSNAKSYTRRLEITYDDIAAILKTRFVNPNSDLIPKLERLGVPFAALKRLKDNNTQAANDEFDKLLPTGAGAPDSAEYGGDIKAWVRRQDNYDRIMKIIVLTDPTANADPCSFDNLEFRFAQPMANLGDTSTRLGAVEFIRLLRFIRLWKKLGWTIEQTDAALCALFLMPLFPLGADVIDTRDKLDAGFLAMLPRLGIVLRVMHALNLTPKRDLLPLLTLWSPLGTHGTSAIYRQMFLNPAMLSQDATFADNGYGEFLQDNTQHLLTHAEALRSAFNLTGDEFDRIITAVGFDANTPLTIDNISAVYRRGWLARKLKLSAREFLLLTELSGLDPFATPDPADPAIMRLIALVQALKARSLKSTAALYLIWNQDLSGKSTPNRSQVAAFARTLRLDFNAVDTDFAIKDDPDGAIAQTRMTLVYGADGAAFFFGLLNDTLITDVPYSRDQATLITTVSYDHGQPTLDQAIIDAAQEFIAYDDVSHQLSFTGAMSTNTRDKLKSVAGVTAQFKAAIDSLYAENEKLTKANLEQSIVDSASGRIAYDDFRKRLSFTGVLSTTIRDALKAAAATVLPSQQAIDDFNTAVDKLYEENQKSISPFFARYPELQTLYDAYAASNDPVEMKRSALLGQILPELVKRRKQQQALQAVSAAAQTTLDLARALLDTSPYGNALHAADDNNQPALNDILALETQGLSVQFFASDTATGTVIPSANIAANLDYAPAVSGVGNPLPSNPTPNAAISGIWQGYIEAPESGFFNLRIETDPGAMVTLVLDDKTIALTLESATIRHNTDSIELRAGALYAIKLTIEKVSQIVRVQWQWQPKGQGRAIIPPRYLYPAALFEAFRQAYLRFLKASALSATLRLTANELAHFSTHADYRINGQGKLDTGGQGWLNALPNEDNLNLANPADAVIAEDLNAALLTPLRDLLDYARIKAETSPDDESLLTILEDPVTAAQEADSPLFNLTRWDKQSLDDLLAHFGGSISGLKGFNLFRRVYDAFALIQRMGISAQALIRATTNEPDGGTVRDLQAALRARYDEADWRTVVQPINDEMRALQRDALVAYILHQMRSKTATEHIDTADKLFEYFLMDVQMEPCMQTSRIRHALSSVQLFIERCLMNLETDVSPASINAKRWEWMKRYRVWEANRKVFLFPENWLEPELRDDKSPFFKEIESELLQSDITDDSAAVAMLNYLSKLEEVAKLEPCGIYHVPGNPQKQVNETDHVIARTAGAHRKYYYRRYENGSWSPWEQVKLDIEDDPVVPVVWNDRLLLFWLRIMKKGDEAAAKPSAKKGTHLTSLTTDDLPGDPTVTTLATLCWSEYYNGKWQPAKTSDIKLPTVIWRASEIGNLAFDRKGLMLTLGERDGALRVGLESDHAWSSFFLLYNTHSLPVRKEDQPEGGVPVPSYFRVADHDDAKFSLTYYGKLKGGFYGLDWEPVMPRHILKPWQEKFRIVETHQEYPTFDAPFFYEDSRHVFFVTTREEKLKIFDRIDYGVSVNPGLGDKNIPPLVGEVDPHIDIGPKYWGDGGPVGPDTGIYKGDAVQRFVTEDANISIGIAKVGSIKYGDHQIGPGGAIPDAKGKT